MAHTKGKSTRSTESMNTKSGKMSGDLSSDQPSLAAMLKALYLGMRNKPDDGAKVAHDPKGLVRSTNFLFMLLADSWNTPPFE